MNIQAIAQKWKVSTITVDGILADAGQPSPQATVELLMGERLAFDDFEKRLGRFARGWESWQARAALTTPSTINVQAVNVSPECVQETAKREHVSTIKEEPK